MAPKEPTRHQLSARLAYQQTTPSFLLKLQNRVAGIPDEDEFDGEDYDGSTDGRPPIPERPAIPQRPDDDPGSADEDEGEERPQVVVLKEGKHMTEREVENEKRKAKGLPPLPDPSKVLPKEAGHDSNKTAGHSKVKHDSKQSLSFSSSKATVKPSNKKRKVIGDDEEGLELSAAAGKSVKKKSKKSGKALLSFGDDEV